MDKYSILAAQIEALAENLRGVKRALGAHQIDPGLREAVRSRFEKLINKQQMELDRLRGEVENELMLESCWSAFRDNRQECVPIFRESLAFLEGALIRSAGMDNGICQMADFLLDDLSHRTGISWERFTILAEEEFFAQMAEIIRLRFPEFSIWNLPVAGHEFGHLVGQELREQKRDGTYRYPFQEILQREGQIEPRNVPFLHEHFADAFATYALGPAFACVCILLRFDPGVAYRDGEEHPGYAKRAYFILKGLEKMDEAEGGVMRPYGGIIELLWDLWQQNLAAAGQPENLDQGIVPQLNEWLEELYLLLDRELPPRARYQGWLRAQRLLPELLSSKEAGRILKDDDTLADVINAAWMCRIQHWDEGSYLVRKIGKEAGELCREITRLRS